MKRIPTWWLTLTTCLKIEKLKVTDQSEKTMTLCLEPEWISVKETNVSGSDASGRFIFTNKNQADGPVHHISHMLLYNKGFSTLFM